MSTRNLRCAVNSNCIGQTVAHRGSDGSSESVLQAGISTCSTAQKCEKKRADELRQNALRICSVRRRPEGFCLVNLSISMIKSNYLDSPSLLPAETESCVIKERISDKQKNKVFSKSLGESICIFSVPRERVHLKENSDGIHSFSKKCFL